MAWRFIPGARRPRARPRVLLAASEEELYPAVMARLLAGRGRVLFSERVGGTVPDFIVDGGVWRVAVEVKTRVTRAAVEQLERYSQVGEPCLALPLNASPGPWDGCVMYINALFAPRRGWRAGGAREVGEVEVRHGARGVHEG